MQLLRIKCALLLAKGEDVAKCFAMIAAVSVSRVRR